MTKEKAIKLGLIFAFIAYYVTCFWIVIKSGYMYDDMWSIADRGIAINHDTNMFQVVWEGTQMWASKYGRILIFSKYSSFMLGFLPLVVYKSVIVASIMLNAIVIAAIAKELTGSTRLKYLIMLVFPAVVVLRTSYFSSLYGFHSLVEFTLLFVTLSIYCYIRYRRTNLIRFQVLSCITWFIALGIYEVAYVLALCFIAVLFCLDDLKTIKKSFWKIIKTGIPQFVIFLVWTIANIVARHFAQGGYGGTEVTLSVKATILTLFKQISGGFSLFGVISHILEIGKACFINMIVDGFHAYYIIFFAIFIAAYILIEKCYKKEPIKHVVPTLVFSSILIILPALLIAITEKYQKEVNWSTGYIPAYITSWGLTILFAVIMIGLSKLFYKKKVIYYIYHIVACLGIALLLLLNTITGSETVQNQNNYYQHDFNTTRTAVKSGLLGDTDGKVYVDVSNATFTTGNVSGVYASWMNQKADVLGMEDLYTYENGVFETTKQYNMLPNSFYCVDEKKREHVVIAKCTGLQLTPREGREVSASAYAMDFDLFVFNHKKESFDRFTYVDSNGREHTMKLNEQDIKSGNNKGTVYSIKCAEPANICSIKMKKVK